MTRLEAIEAVENQLSIARQTLSQTWIEKEKSEKEARRVTLEALLVLMRNST